MKIFNIPHTNLTIQRPRSPSSLIFNSLPLPLALSSPSSRLMLVPARETDEALLVVDWADNLIVAAFRSSVRKIFVICDVDDVTSKPVVVPLGDEMAGPITTLLLLADRDIHGVEVELDGVIDEDVLFVAGVVEIVLAVEFVAVM